MNGNHFFVDGRTDIPTDIPTDIFLFYESDPFVLDLWPCKTKINRGLVLKKTIQNVKYESPVIKNCFKIMIGNHLVYRQSISVQYFSKIGAILSPISWHVRFNSQLAQEFWFQSNIISYRHLNRTSASAWSRGNDINITSKISKYVSV